MTACTLTFLNFVLTLVTLTCVTNACPLVCFCPAVSRIVFCDRKNLTVIPYGVPMNSVQLIMNDNQFQNPELQRQNLTRLIDLEHLYLRNCGIEQIAVNAFVDLKRLKWLDLSSNRMRVIENYTFRNLNLEHLFLNDNPGITISSRAFVGLTLQGLYMHSCGLRNMGLTVFQPLNGTLKSLWLHQNDFTSFSKEWLYFFGTLSHIRLGGNPIHCNCEMSWLINFFNRTRRTFEGGEPPSCKSPRHLQGRSFEHVTDQDIRCDLPVFKNVDVIFESYKGVLTCMASGDPVPTLTWIKPNGNQEVFQPRLDENARILDNVNEAVLYIRRPGSPQSRKYQCVAENQAGNVTLSLNIVWPQLSPISESILNDVPGVCQTLMRSLLRQAKLLKRKKRRTLNKSKCICPPKNHG
ncbi:hypothetical protein ACJMK2_005744 [Sinanodonta woodiana]|uniref:Ig-like domain-containing protein n=1 Tax=Sinanodonta woodiana TaxID=1069815 RepID=A0ABD3VR14_SINWO